MTPDESYELGIISKQERDQLKLIAWWRERASHDLHHADEHRRADNHTTSLVLEAIADTLTESAIALESTMVSS